MTHSHQLDSPLRYFTPKLWRELCAGIIVVFSMLFLSSLLFLSRADIHRISPDHYAFASIDCLCIGLLLCMFFSTFRSTDMDRGAAYFTLLLWANAAYLYWDEILCLTSESPALWPITFLFHHLFYMGGILQPWLYWHFLRAWQGLYSDRVRRISHVIDLLSLAALLPLLSNPWTHIYFTFTPETGYARSPTYPISVIWPLLILTACVVLIIQQVRTSLNKNILLVLPLLPYVGSLVTARANSTSLMLSKWCFFSVFLIYCVLYVDRQKKLALQYSALTQKNVELLLSQVQSHFIANTLLTIQGLYHEDMERADQIMDSFNSYLQQKFRELNTLEPIPAERELEHVQCYTDIETARWEDMTVEYQLETLDFMLPAMSIQPLVENAIRHGLLPRRKGGTVIVSTFEDENAWYVQVEDDGVGFDPDTPPQDSYRHIGIVNIRDRLQAMVNGTLIIRSVPDQGTTALISIPKASVSQSQ